MPAETLIIPLETAHKILARFGITKPTRAYDRWVKAYGFDVPDFWEVLNESPYLVVVDWKAGLREDVIAIVTHALGLLEVRLKFELDPDGNEGFVWTEELGRRAKVKYLVADDDSMDDVFEALQWVAPEAVEFRGWTGNGGGDTSIYAVLPRDEWGELDRDASVFRQVFFRPLRS